MRAAALFLRARLAGRTAGAIAAAALLLWIPFEADLEVTDWALFRLALVAPLAPAVLIAAGAHDPFGELEAAAGRSLPCLRLLHLSLLLAWAAAAVALTLTGRAGPFGDAAVFRNLCGFTGLALLGACLLGSRLSWAVPVAFLLFVWLGHPSTAWQGQDVGAAWGWPVQPGRSLPALGAAGALLAVGAGLVAAFGAREGR